MPIGRKKHSVYSMAMPPWRQGNATRYGIHLRQIGLKKWCCKSRQKSKGRPKREGALNVRFDQARKFADQDVSVIQNRADSVDAAISSEDSYQRGLVVLPRSGSRRPDKSSSWPHQFCSSATSFHFWMGFDVFSSAQFHHCLN